MPFTANQRRDMVSAEAAFAGNKGQSGPAGRGHAAVFERGFVEAALWLPMARYPAPIWQVELGLPALQDLVPNSSNHVMASLNHQRRLASRFRIRALHRHQPATLELPHVRSKVERGYPTAPPGRGHAQCKPESELKGICTPAHASPRDPQLPGLSIGKYSFQPRDHHIGIEPKTAGQRIHAPALPAQDESLVG